MNKYDLLNSDDHKYIAERTNYAKGYVRQILKGYIPASKRSEVILVEADKLLKEKSHES
jgi:hypothetical protein